MRRQRIQWVAGAVLLVIASGASVAPAQAPSEPVLHERYEPSAAEDAMLQATSLDGTLPAAIVTRSGAVSLENAQAAQATTADVFTTKNQSGEESYHADPDPRRPDRVSYSDPFTPTIPPYKRLYAYDSVGDKFELIVAHPANVSIAVGEPARLEDDQFYADLSIQFTGNLPVRIPSVAPGARVLAAHATPVQDFALFHDSADNWFAQSSRTGFVELTLQLAVDRNTFGSAFAAASWAQLKPWVAQLPPSVVAAAHDVAAAIGIAKDASVAEAVTALVAHFRDFAASDSALNGQGEALYRELSLAKKGVCRHRSYGFVVTALGLGIPSRFVRNEAHAWVEVFDGRLWHRIDLGGAAAQASLNLGQRATHVVPQDPYRWPPNAAPASDMTERALRASSTPSNTAAAGPAAQRSAQGPTPNASDHRVGDSAEDNVPAASVTVLVNAENLRRGSRVRVSGRVNSANGPCNEVRVDLSLRQGLLQSYPLGTFVTDAQGSYVGNVAIPFNVPVGDYTLEAYTPGRALVCGVGRSLAE
ncbi:MAG TPA: transglutaminase-like domain-containing protein [Polyangiaceae bacterium]|nr:transglutaminase-like domain-containing protein [Polyangiaceae bacterium]